VRGGATRTSAATHREVAASLTCGCFRASVPPVQMPMPAAGRAGPGARRARWLAGLIVPAAVALVLSGCQSERNVSRAYDCSKEREYQGPGASACDGQRGGSALSTGHDADPARPAVRR
jgi:hypothetical protein